AGDDESATSRHDGHDRIGNRVDRIDGAGLDNGRIDRGVGAWLGLIDRVDGYDRIDSGLDRVDRIGLDHISSEDRLDHEVRIDDRLDREVRIDDRLDRIDRHDRVHEDRLDRRDRYVWLDHRGEPDDRQRPGDHYDGHDRCDD